MSMAFAINWLPRGLSIVNFDKRPDQMVNRLVDKVNMVRVVPKIKPVAMVKPMAMVSPLKRENPENFRTDSPCKKFKVSEDLFKLDELSKYAIELNKPTETEKVDPKTSSKLTKDDGHVSVKMKSKLSLSAQQRAALVEAFAEEQFVGKEKEADLAENLGLGKKRVTNWFEAKKSKMRQEALIRGEEEEYSAKRYMFKWSFTVGQRQELGRAFAENENIKGQELAKLAENLHLRKKQVGNWFRGKRIAKGKVAKIAKQPVVKKEEDPLKFTVYQKETGGKTFADNKDIKGKALAKLAENIQLTHRKKEGPSEYQQTKYLTAIDAKYMGEPTSQPETTKTETVGSAEISENQCGDCYKVMKSVKTVIDHKKKFRCPGKKFGSIKQTDGDLNAKKSLSEVNNLEKAAEDKHKQEGKPKHEKRHKVQSTEEGQNVIKSIAELPKLDDILQKVTHEPSTRSATEARQLSCSGCKVEFSHAKNLRKHIRSGECANSEVRFSIKSHQNNNEKSVYAESSKCGKCDRQFNFKNSLKRHMERNICSGSISETISAIEINSQNCDKCERQFCSKDALRRHVEKAVCLKLQKEEVLSTFELKTIRCEKCDRQLCSKDTLRKHVEKGICLNQKEEVLSTLELKSSQCGKCDRKFNQVGNLRRHVERASCSKYAKDKSLFATKLASVQCNKYEKNLMEKWKLKSHTERALCSNNEILSPNEILTGKCDGCEKYFNKKYNLRYHIESTSCKSEILSAIELDSGNCNACGKHFNDRGNMRMHKRKSNCTNVEQKGIDQMGVLTATEFSSGECDMCGRSYNAVSNLRRHKTKYTCRKDGKPINLTEVGTSSGSFTTKTETEKEEKEKKVEADRSSPSEAMLTSAIDQLMTSLGKEKAETTKEDEKEKQNQEVTKEKRAIKGKENAKATGEESDLLVCGVISTPTGKISIVQPKNALLQTGSDFGQGMAKNGLAQSGSDVKLGMAKLKFLATRLFKGKLTLATVIATTRLPNILIKNKSWI